MLQRLHFQPVGLRVLGAIVFSQVHEGASACAFESLGFIEREGLVFIELFFKRWHA